MGIGYSIIVALSPEHPGTIDFKFDSYLTVRLINYYSNNIIMNV